MPLEQQQDHYFKGIYPVEVLSEAKDGLVAIRAKTTFMHTSGYLKNTSKNHPRVGRAKKRWVRQGEVLKVPVRFVWSHRRQVAKGHS